MKFFDSLRMTQKMKQIDYKKYPMPRIRHHANPVLYFPLKQHKNRNFSYPELVEKFQWSKLFSDGKTPVYLDVGSGMGKFLIEMALENPTINILGLELRKVAVEWISRVISGEKIGNAAILWYSVVNGLPFIESGSVEKIFYLFPDPWIKKRHHKRRAFSVKLLGEFHRILSQDGMLYIMTDVSDVDDYHVKILDTFNFFTYEYVQEWNLEVKTNQEEFCLAKQIPFSRIICKKTKN
jgi:tRNA (guanine-N7-)-methyltransferase